LRGGKWGAQERNAAAVQKLLLSAKCPIFTFENAVEIEKDCD